MTNLDKLPDELKRSSRWVTWRLEDFEDRKRCKVPKTIKGQNASSTDPETWCSLDEAQAHLPKPHPSYKDDPACVGVGLVIGAPYLGVDVDKCYDPETGKVDPWAQELIAKLPRTYAELSPSRRGFHFWYRSSDHGKLPDGVRTEKAEVYSRKRYFTVTGDHVVSSLTHLTELSPAQAATIFNLIEGLRPTRTKTETVLPSLKLEELMNKADFPDLSAAVHSLLTKLAIDLTGNRKQIEELFKKSALYETTHWKEKWERLRESELDKACANAHENVQRRLAKKLDLSACVKRAKVIGLEDVEPRQLEWLWPERVPRGNVTIFAGAPGVGKSLLALDLLGRGSLGAAYLDKKPSLGAYKSLLLAGEDDRETILVPRLMALGADLKMIRCVDMLEYVGEGDEVAEVRAINLESDLSAIRDVLRGDPTYQLLVVDPLSNYMGNKSMYRDQEMRAVMMPMVTLAQETGIAIIVIMHNSKQTGRSALEKVGASLGGVGTARIGWSFVKTQEDRVQVLLMKANLGRFKGLEFGTETVGVKIGDKVTDQAKLVYLGEAAGSIDSVLAWQEDPEERKEKLVHQLIKKLLPRGKETPSSIIFEASDKAGISNRAVQRARAELGITTVRKRDGWYWRWMDEAQASPTKKEAEETLF